MNPLQIASLWLPVVIYMAAIFRVSSMSVVPGIVGGISDTVLHTTCYAGLALVTLRAVAKGRWAAVTLGTLAAAWLIATAYGATDEWHQMYTPGRTSEFRDFRNDAVGALAAMAVVWAWGIMRRSRRTPSHDL